MRKDQRDLRRTWNPSCPSSSADTGHYHSIVVYLQTTYASSGLVVSLVLPTMAFPALEIDLGSARDRLESVCHGCCKDLGCWNRVRLHVCGEE